MGRVAVERSGETICLLDADLSEQLATFAAAAGQTLDEYTTRVLAAHVALAATIGYRIYKAQFRPQSGGASRELPGAH